MATLGPKFRMPSGAMLSKDKDGQYQIDFQDGWYAVLYPDPVKGKIRMELHDTDPNPSDTRLEEKMDEMKEARKNTPFDSGTYTVHSPSHFTITSHLDERKLRR